MRSNKEEERKEWRKWKNWKKEEEQLLRELNVPEEAILTLRILDWKAFARECHSMEGKAQ